MEERTIKLSLEKAKEWYRAGGNLAEIALQAYTEKELSRVDYGPESWDEYCKTGKGSVAWISYTSEEPACVRRGINDIFNKFNDESEAIAFSALGKLIQLRDAWWKQANWEPKWTEGSVKYCICTDCDRNIIRCCYHRHQVIFAFPEEEMRDRFLECFRDLIEKAQMFI